MAQKGNTQWMYLVGGALVVVALVYYLGNSRTTTASTGATEQQVSRRDLEVDIHLPGHSDSDVGAKVEHYQNQASEPLPRPKDTSLSCAGKDQLKPEELLPLDEDTEWSKANPVQQTLQDKNFLTAGHNVGINTVGQTLRNANLQLRSEPPNPQTIVSPWLQSTIEPDVMRQPLEIGGGCP
jgi:hypothetical protein